MPSTSLGFIGVGNNSQTRKGILDFDPDIHRHGVVDLLCKPSSTEQHGSSNKVLKQRNCRGARHERACDKKSAVHRILPTRCSQHLAFTEWI